MKDWQITGICALLILGFLLMSGCTKSPETVYSAIQTHGKYDIDWEGHATLNNTYTVEGTFTNTGTKPYTFWGAVTLYDSLNVPQEFKGENMTLNPGESKTIVETYVVSYRFKNKGIDVVVREHELK
jgi:hypothetical protein